MEQNVEREKSRQDFLAEAQASWLEYQESGLHLTGDEISQWLKSWGSGRESVLPRCHD
jgi:predicted transcriptional regulator